MSTIVPENWPTGIRDLALAARDLAKPVAERVVALQSLGAALESNECTLSIHVEVTSFFATFVAIADEPAEIRNSAISLLIPTVRLAAARFVGVSNRACQDFEGECHSHIWMQLSRGKFDPKKGNVVAWINRLVTNYFRTCGRDFKATTVAKSALLPEETRDDHTNEASSGVDWDDFQTAPLTDRDQRTVDGWTIHQRLVVLSLAGLWRKVDNEKWREWVEAAGAKPPFPPAEFHTLEKQSQLESCLASALEMKPATVTKSWYRGLETLLPQLECLRRLRP